MSEEIPAAPSSVSFHYDKIDGFRSYHVDGAFGGISPRGFINMAVYCERNPLPRRVDLEVKEVVGQSMKLGDELDRDSLSGVFRELQCNLILDLAAAKGLHNWLGEKIDELEKIIEKSTGK